VLAEVHRLEAAGLGDPRFIDDLLVSLGRRGTSTGQWVGAEIAEGEQADVHGWNLLGQDICAMNGLSTYR
jgi:hypothetical protein